MTEFTAINIAAGDRILTSGFTWPIGTPGEYSVESVSNDSRGITFRGRKWADGYSYPIPGTSVTVPADTPVHIFGRTNR
jgi:hypothetical protein